MHELGSLVVGAGWIRDLATDKSGAVVYATSDDGLFYAVSPRDAKAAWSVKVGSNPNGFAITPDGLRAYIANFGSGTVSVVDLANHKLLTDIDVGPNPWDVAIQSDGTRVYVAMRRSTSVPIIDTHTNRVLQNLEVGSPTTAIAISLDGAVLYLATEGPDGLTVVRANDGYKLTMVPLGEEISALAVSPRDPLVYVRERKSSQILQVSTSDYSYIGLETGAPSRNFDPEAMVISPNSRRLAYTLFPAQRIGQVRTPFAAPKRTTKPGASAALGMSEGSQP